LNVDSWIFVADDEPIGGLLKLARELGGRVTVAVVGPRARADAVAAAGPDRVRWHRTTDRTPPEAFAGQIAAQAKQASPRVLLSSDAPSARVLLGAASAQLGAALVSSVRAIALEGEQLVVSRPAVEGKVIETLEASGALACIFDGENVPVAAAQPAAVEEVPTEDLGDALLVVETIPAAGGSAGLRLAARVVAAGLGIRTKGDLALVEDLAAAVRAEIACTLPVCDDMRWYDANHVVGRTHNQIAPDLYIAVGISGQPQHMVGVRDAKVVVAINNDPNAPIFKACDYAILGDLYKVVPALTAALQ
jgi:electron transfer flavoprotein alpha subunit